MKPFDRQVLYEVAETGSTLAIPCTSANEVHSRCATINRWRRKKRDAGTLWEELDELKVCKRFNPSPHLLVEYPDYGEEIPVLDANLQPTGETSKTLREKAARRQQEARAKEQRELEQAAGVSEAEARAYDRKLKRDLGLPLDNASEPTSQLQQPASQEPASQGSDSEISETAKQEIEAYLQQIENDQGPLPADRRERLRRQLEDERKPPSSQLF